MLAPPKAREISRAVSTSILDHRTCLSEQATFTAGLRSYECSVSQPSPVELVTKKRREGRVPFLIGMTWRKTVPRRLSGILSNVKEAEAISSLVQAIADLDDQGPSTPCVWLETHTHF